MSESGATDTALTSSSIRQIAENIGWLFFSRSLNLGASLVVGVWVARYLGPTDYGKLNYALAFVALFATIATLGLNGIVVRDLARSPQTAEEVLGSAFVMRLAGALIAILLAFAGIWIVRPDDALMHVMVLIVSMGLVFNASEVIKYYFESLVLSKYVVWVENSVLVVISALKVGLILGGAPLMAFIYVVLAESIVVAGGLFYVLSRRGVSVSRWVIRSEVVRQLLRDAWPQLISSFSIVFYMRVDKIMIGQMLGDKEVGVYSIAVTLSEACYFVAIAVNASLNPSLFKLNESSSSLFNARLQKRFDLMILLAVPIALLVTLFGGLLIRLLFNLEYQGAIAVLTVHVWAGVFVFLNNAVWAWYFAENKQGLANRRILVGLALNIVLNVILIPRYGIIGAAWATLIARAFVAYFGQLMNRETRHLFRMMTRSLFFISAIQALRSRFDSQE